MDDIPLDDDLGDDSFFRTMSKLDSTLERAKRSSSKVDVVDDCWNYPMEEEVDPLVFSDECGNQLPTVEEVRTNHAAKTIRERRLRRRENCWKIAFFVVLAGLVGMIIGIALGFREGQQIQKLEHEANDPIRDIGKPQEPSPSYAILTSSPTPDPTILTNSFITAPPTPKPTSIEATPQTTSPVPKPTEQDNDTTVPKPADPSNSRLTRVQQWLINNEFSSEYDFDNEDSYHFKAGLWIADEDEAQLSIRDDGKFVERYVMALLWFASNENEDETVKWENNFNFISNLPVCEWGEDIENMFRAGITCDDSGRILKIRLVSNNLRGPLITELGLLQNLKHLRLDHNALTGSIPEQLAELTNLSYLALHYNELSGKLRTSIGALTNLEFLGLGDNGFSGEIPQEWKALKDLTTLGLDDNLLDEGLEILGDLTKLQRLYIGSNEFDNNLENIEWDKLPELEEVDLSNNELVGSIPTSLIQLPKLQVLTIAHNKVTGILPDLSSSSSTLKYLALSGNVLSGSIHDSIGALVNLRHLDLSENKLTGTLPKTMKSLTNLEYLFLSKNNDFKPSGVVDFFKYLTNLRDLSIASTNRVGEIPGHVLIELSNLIMLDLSSNGLESTIPSVLGNLKKLRYILLNRNDDLEGTVPDEVQNLPDLSVFMVDQTSVTGNLTLICNRDSKPKVQIIGANCHTADDGDKPEPRMECECCAVCCDSVGTELGPPDDTMCHDGNFFGQEDPIWENSFYREQYNFGVVLADVIGPINGD